MKEPYGVGLDIGTNSVGWTVVDASGHVRKIKGQTGIGVRLFKEGAAAADRRGFRTTRRRLKRVKWRLRLLREFFDQPISKVDINFFARRKYSDISPRDPNYNGLEKTLFNDRSDQDFYHDYPTIYHLREALMTQHRKFDVREIYLAIHHIVKYRGNFLRNDAATAYRSGTLDLQQHFETLNHLFSQADLELNLNLTTDVALLDSIKQTLVRTDISRSDRQKLIMPLLAVLTGATTAEKKRQKAVVTEFAKALVGNKTKIDVLTLTDIDATEAKDWAFSLEENQDKLPGIEDRFSEVGQQIIDEVIRLYASVNLAQLIPEGKRFSQSMVEKYKRHGEDLKLLKAYMRSQSDAKRGRAIRATYDQYIDGVKSKQVTQEAFQKALGKFVDADVDLNSWAAQIKQAIDSEQFMPKLRTKQNGAIPYQVQQNELDQIISNQKEYYPWLGEENPVIKRRGKFPYKLDELVGFRVPYYVGPLITKEMQAATANAGFAWMVRKADGPITPWNFDDKVDRVASATAFIQRMQTTDTYLIGEEVLPARSLIYQRFMVLNELNNIRVDDGQLTPRQKQRLYNQVFKKYKRVTAKNIQDNLVAAGEFPTAPRITGLADPKVFNSSLSTYHDLKQVLPEAMSDVRKQADIEKIILWSTIFEDSTIFKQKLTEISWLTAAQLKQLGQLRYRGWGQLSRKLLTGLKDDNNRSIMDGLWETNANFMQLRSQPAIENQIKSANQANLTTADLQDTINELYTSPQNKKAIREVMVVLADIKDAMHGQTPNWIFVEAARGGGVAGRRTQSRSKQIVAAYQGTAQAIVRDQVQRELKEKIKNKANFNTRLVLYFLQNGRDLYTGDAINIDRLSEYDIDHILPQSLVKDDSLDNRVLTNARINREKNDTFASEKFGKKMGAKWKEMHRMGLMTKRKLDHLLMRPDEISKYATGFINRQLVETRQVIKLVEELINAEYPSTAIVSVKANLTHQFRQTFDFPKIREVNDYHHAFDAALTAFIGTYLLKRYPKLERFFIYGKFAKQPVNLTRFNVIRKLAKTDTPITDIDTGEVLWDKLTDIKYFETLYDYKRLLVTREVSENYGAMFDQTLLKASDNGKRLIRKKQSFDTAIYGGYTGKTLAYMAIVKVSTKKDVQYQVVGVPTTMVTQIEQLEQQGMTNKQAVTKVIEPLIAANNKKMLTYEVLLPKVRFEQVVRDRIKGQTHRFALGTDTYYHNIQELYLPLTLQRAFLGKQNESEVQLNQNLLTVFDATLAQVNRYFPLYEMNKFKKILNSARDQIELLEAKNQFVKNKLVLGKQGILTNMFIGLHANASYGDLKVLGVKTDFGKLQVPGGIKLTGDAEIIYQSPTGLFERKISLKDL